MKHSAINGVLEEIEKEVYRLDDDVILENKEYELTFEQKEVLKKIKFN